LQLRMGAAQIDYTTPLLTSFHKLQYCGQATADLVKFEWKEASVKACTTRADKVLRHAPPGIALVDTLRSPPSHLPISKSIDCHARIIYAHLDMLRWTVRFHGPLDRRLITARSSRGLRQYLTVCDHAENGKASPRQRYANGLMRS
jgi:hypothetical protein